MEEILNEIRNKLSQLSIAKDKIEQFNKGLEKNQEIIQGKKEEAEKIEDKESGFYKDAKKEVEILEKKRIEVLTIRDQERRKAEKGTEKIKNEIVLKLREKQKFLDENRNMDLKNIDINSLRNEKAKLERQIEIASIMGDSKEFEKLSPAEKRECGKAHENYLINKKRLSEISPTVEMYDLLDGKTPLEKFNEISGMIKLIEAKFNFRDFEQLRATFNITEKTVENSKGQETKSTTEINTPESKIVRSMEDLRRNSKMNTPKFTQEPRAIKTTKEPKENELDTKYVNKQVGAPLAPGAKIIGSPEERPYRMSEPPKKPEEKPIQANVEKNVPETKNTVPETKNTVPVKEQKDESFVNEDLSRKIIEEALKDDTKPVKKEEKLRFNFENDKENSKIDYTNSQMKIKYSTIDDTYLIKDDATESFKKVKREELQNITVKEIAEKYNLEERDLENADPAILNIFVKYDEQHNSKKLSKYMRTLIEMEKEDKEINQEVLKENAKLTVSYDLTNLYGDVIKDSEGKTEKLSFEDRQQILYVANRAKKMGMADVKKGFKVNFREAIDKITRTFTFKTPKMLPEPGTRFTPEEQKAFDKLVNGDYLKNLDKDYKKEIDNNPELQKEIDNNEDTPKTKTEKSKFKQFVRNGIEKFDTVNKIIAMDEKNKKSEEDRLLGKEEDLEVDDDEIEDDR